MLRTFNFRETTRKVIINLTKAYLWDQSAMEANDKIGLSFLKQGSEIILPGTNTTSATLLNGMALHDKPDILGKSGMN